MKNVFKIFAPIAFVALCVAALVLLAFNLSETLHGEYSAHVNAGTSEEVEAAISNAVSDVKHHNFILVGLEVKHGFKHYTVTARGIDKAKLSSMDSSR